MKISSKIATILFCASSLSQAAITSRQAALIGLRDSTPDEFSVVALADLNAGDSLYFGDAGVNGTTVAKTADLFRATIGTTIPAGTILTFRDSATGVGTTWIPSVVGSGSITVSVLNTGPYSDGDANANISGNDPFSLFASTDNAATTANATHLFGVNSTVAYTPNELGLGNGIISRTSGQDLRYTGPSNGTADELFTAISLQTNWEVFTSTGAGATNNFGATTFSVTTVPEPSSSILLSFAFVSLMTRRKR